MKVKIVIFVLFVLITTSCANRFKKLENQQYVELEKSACMGPCPVFKLTVFQDEAKLVGSKNVAHLGNYTAVINKNISDEVFSYLKNAEVLNSSSEYINNEMLDLPTTILRLFDGKSVKEIKVYGEKPNHLMPLIELLNSQRKKLEWVKVK